MWTNVFHFLKQRLTWLGYYLTATQSPPLIVNWHFSLTEIYFFCLFAIQIRAEQLAAEGWEYSPVFTMKFHAKERKMDLVRRRRWHRKMVQDDPSAPAVFHIDVGSSDDVRILVILSSPNYSFVFSNVVKLYLIGMTSCFFPLSGLPGSLYHNVS